MTAERNVHASSQFESKSKTACILHSGHNTQIHNARLAILSSMSVRTQHHPCQGEDETLSLWWCQSHLVIIQGPYSSWVPSNIACLWRAIMHCQVAGIPMCAEAMNVAPRKGFLASFLASDTGTSSLRPRLSPGRSGAWVLNPFRWWGMTLKEVHTP